MQTANSHSCHQHTVAMSPRDGVTSYGEQQDAARSVLLKIRASKGRWKHKTKIVRICLRTLDFLWGRRPGSVAGPWGKVEMAGRLAVPLT